MNLHLGSRLAALATAALLTLVMVIGVNTLATQQQSAPDLMSAASSCAVRG